MVGNVPSMKPTVIQVRFSLPFVISLNPTNVVKTIKRRLDDHLNKQEEREGNERGNEYQVCKSLYVVCISEDP